MHSNAAEGELSASEDVFLPQSEVRQFEAKLSDIPAPLDALPVPEYFSSESRANDSSYVIGYRTAMTCDHIVDYFNKEMERLGWRQTYFIKAYESILHFEKPSRWCSVSFRPYICLDQTACANLVIACAQKQDSA